MEGAISEWEEIGWTTELPLVNASYTVVADALDEGGVTTCTYSADLFNQVEGKVEHFSVKAVVPPHMVFGYPEYMKGVEEELKKALQAQMAAKEKEIADALVKQMSTGQLHALYETDHPALTILGSIAAQGGYYTPKAYNKYDLFAGTSVEESHQTLARKLRTQAPGLNEEVKHPCDCAYAAASIWSVIQHLNDGHHPMTASKDIWTRERIADWLDALDVDLTIHTKEEA
jgi:hypothetical protein